MINSTLQTLQELSGSVISVSNSTIDQTYIDGEEYYLLDHEVGNKANVAGADMKIAGVTDDAQINYKSLTETSFRAVLHSDWNTVKNIDIDSSELTNVTVRNFVHADVSLAGTDNTVVKVIGAKRGFIDTDEGNDLIVIRAETNGDGWSNTFDVDTGAGNDTVKFFGDGHTDIVADTGSGNDFVKLFSAYEQSDLDLGLGNDKFIGGNYADHVDGGAGTDNINGKSGDDVLVGGNGNDLLKGGAGNDVLIGNSQTANQSGDVITNGGFEDLENATGHKDYGSWNLLDSMNGWTATSGKIEVQEKAHGGTPGQVDGNFIELDSGGKNSNSTVSQDVYIDNGGTFVLSFDYSGRDKGGLKAEETSDFHVLVNGEIVQTYTNVTKGFQPGQIELQLDGGVNTISFQGAGVQDTYGALIDNVSLVSASVNNDTLIGGAGDDILIGGTNDLQASVQTKHNFEYVKSQAGYHNTFGVYEVGDNGEILNVRIVFDSMKQYQIGDEESLVSDSADLQTFIVADGYRKNGGYDDLDLDGDHLSFIYNYGLDGQRVANIDDAADNVTLVYNDGTTEKVINGYDYHETDSLNHDGMDHSIDDVHTDGSRLVRFEDLPNLGDRDYTDVEVAYDRDTLVTVNYEAGSDNDFLKGGAGNDLMVGGTGNDNIIGGQGTDIAFFYGSIDEYNIMHVGGRTYTIEDTVAGRDGVDIIRSVEGVIFGVEDLIVDIFSNWETDDVQSEFGVESVHDLELTDILGYEAFDDAIAEFVGNEDAGIKETVEVTGVHTADLGITHVDELYALTTETVL